MAILELVLYLLEQLVKPLLLFLTERLKATLNLQSLIALVVKVEAEPTPE
jgi:hypothetical protein